jgi:hypothetical protein
MFNESRMKSVWITKCELLNSIEITISETFEKAEISRNST